MSNSAYPPRGGGGYGYGDSSTGNKNYEYGGGDGSSSRAEYANYQTSDRPDPYAPKPSHPAPGGGYGFDYNFGLNDSDDQREEHLRHRDVHHDYQQRGDPNADANATVVHGDRRSTAAMYRSASQSSQSAEISPPPLQRGYPTFGQYGTEERSTPQRSASGASTSSKTELTGTTVQVRRTHDFGADYPEGWTQEDMEAEKAFLKEGMLNWTDLRDWRFWIRAKWWYYYLALIIIVVLVVLMTIYHDQIVTWCEPAANKIKNLPGGWSIPIGILFIISFPPLFGHEIVAIICGLVWGLWIGFGIVCAGTFLGEVGNYYAFKYCCRSRAEKYERKNMAYACLAHTMREGSLWIIIAARLSAIPGHLTTAVFSTCGMNIWIFMLGAFLTLPKQLITVYLGVIFKGDEKSKTNKIISYTVLVVGFLITIAAAWYIWYEMHKVRVVVFRKRRMEMASRGISLSALEYGGRKSEVDVEARPILRVDPAHAGHDHSPHHQRHLVGSPQHMSHPFQAAPSHSYQAAPSHSSDRLRDLGSPEILRSSYQTPYDISYKKTNDDMSLYHVDALTERLNMEADIVDHLKHNSTQNSYAAAGQESLFPQAQTTGLRREPSAASAFYRPGDERPEVIPSSFPPAKPYGASF